MPYSSPTSRGWYLGLRSHGVEVAFSILGPLSAVIDGVDVTPRPQKERALLALLVVNNGRAVSADRLMEELWPDLTADRARRVLQVRVAAVRKMLNTANAASLVELVAPGYQLDVEADLIDEHRFITLVERARGQANAGDPAGAAASLRGALDLWRGEPLADVQVCMGLEAESARLHEARLQRDRGSDRRRTCVRLPPRRGVRVGWARGQSSPAGTAVGPARVGPLPVRPRGRSIALVHVVPPTAGRRVRHGAGTLPPSAGKRCARAARRSSTGSRVPRQVDRTARNSFLPTARARGGPPATFGGCDPGGT